MSNVTERSIEAEVKQILEGSGHKQPMFSVRACHTGASKWSCGKPNGMFSIDLWGIRTPNSNRRDRSHMFRTTKDGEVPTAKIAAYARQRFEAMVNTTIREKTIAEAAQHNEATAERLRTLGTASTNQYFSAYTGGAMISGNSGVADKFRVNIGTLLLDEASTVELLTLLAKLAPRNS